MGFFAVQLARLAGTQAIVTASAHNRDFLGDLGANEIINYTTTRSEEVVRGVDLALNLVGGDTLDPRVVEVIRQKTAEANQTDSAIL